MKRVWFLSSVLALALVFGCTASAVTIAAINAGGGCKCVTIDDKTFSDFSVAYTGAVFTESDVDVQLSQGTDAGVLYDYITFGGAFLSGSGASRDMRIFYSVTATQGLIASIDQHFDLTAIGTGGVVGISEFVRSGSFGGTTVANSNVSFDSASPGTHDFDDPPGELVQGDSLNLAPPLAKVYVSKDITAIGNAGGSVGASILKQSFHQVPEPAQSAVLLGGLLMIGLYYKSRRKAQV